MDEGTDEPDDVVDAEIVEEPVTEVDEVSAADIRSQIENAESEPEPTRTDTEPSADPEPEPSPSADLEPEPSTESEPSAGVWHEPTTDELRITHPDHAFDQPDLFDTEQPPGDTPDSTGSDSTDQTPRIDSTGSRV